MARLEDGFSASAVCRSSASQGAVSLGLVGLGKIARDQHLPAIAQIADFDLTAIASRHAQLDDLPGFQSIEAMLASGHDIDAVSLCTPPQGRYLQAEAAIAAGCHVMLEKPPGATISEVVRLHELARKAGVTLFATWHSREAASVDAARDWLADKEVRSVRIDWREDIRVWHPGQDWILAAGGFGVFDPGINALSIATAILPEMLTVQAASLDIPEGRDAPIAASLDMRHGQAPVVAEFDFLNEGSQQWDITIVTDCGTVRLTDGGKTMRIDSGQPVEGRDEEYPRLYRRFADLIRSGSCDVDLRPIRLVADAFMVATTKRVASFDF